MPQSIAITTAQNVTLDYQLANLGDRILAYIIDTLIKGGYIILVLVLVLGQLSNVGTMVISTIGFILTLPVIFYSLLFEIFNNGQTPGKSALNIKVVHLEGEEVNLSSYFLRWLFRIVDLLIMSGIIGTIVIALSEKGQRIGDMVANTTVISTKKKASVKETAFVEIEDDYEPSFPSVVNLTTDDIVTIKEVLKLKGEDAFALKLKLSEKLESVLGTKKEKSSDEFLRQIIKDFNYFEQVEN